MRKIFPVKQVYIAEEAILAELTLTLRLEWPVAMGTLDTAETVIRWVMRDITDNAEKYGLVGGTLDRLELTFRDEIPRAKES